MSNTDMNRSEKIGALIFKYNWGRLSASEKQELKNWRNESEANEALFQQETDLERVIREVNEVIDSREEIWQKLVERMPELKGAREEKPVMNRFWLRIAATIATTIIMAGYSYNNWKKNLVEPGGYEAGVTNTSGVRIIDDMVRGYRTGLMGIKFIWKTNGEKIAIVPNNPDFPEDQFFELNTPLGNMMPFLMPNGTMITLNASSIIQFPANFNFPRERYFVSGQALVEIPDDPNRINTILTARSAIETTGARFGLRVYRSDSFIRLSVLKGSVRFIKNVDAKNSEPVSLAAGQELVYEKGTVSISPIRDTLEVSGWTEGRTYYKNADLGSMLKDLARWYDVELTFRGTPSGQKYNLDLPRDAKFEDVMGALQKQGVHLFLKGRKLDVFSNQ